MQYIEQFPFPLLELKSLNCLYLTISDRFGTGIDLLTQLLILNHHETLNEIYLNTYVEIKTTDILIFENLHALKSLALHCKSFDGVLPQIFKITQIKKIYLSLDLIDNFNSFFHALCNQTTDDLKKVKSYQVSIPFRNT